MENLATVHKTALTALYRAWNEGDLAAVTTIAAPSFSFQIYGTSTLAGKYDAASLKHYFQKKNELNYQFEVHDILSSELHGTVLGSTRLKQGEKTSELRFVHVWRFENGKPLAGYEYARDLYQFDQILRS